MSTTVQPPNDVLGLPAGTVVHVKGLPFTLKGNVLAEGHPTSCRLVRDQTPVPERFDIVEESWTWALDRPVVEKDVRRALNRIWFERGLEASEIHLSEGDWQALTPPGRAYAVVPEHAAAAPPHVSVRALAHQGRIIPVILDGQTGQVRLVMRW